MILNFPFNRTNAASRSYLTRACTVRCREFLAGPALEVEVHDQDRKTEQPPVTFGPSSGLKQKTGASSFGIAHLSLSEKALFSYGVNFRNSETEDLDFVSGFHVRDKQMHIFVLEGLKHKAVKSLWVSVPMT